MVSPPGGVAGVVEGGIYSVVYFARPNDEVVLKGLEGSSEGFIPEVMGQGADGEENVTSKEWILRMGLERKGWEGRWE